MASEFVDQAESGEREERYHALVNSIDVAFCLIKMLFDESGKPGDYLFLETNPAFERHTGLTNVVGKTVREVVPDHDVIWFEVYGNVALTGVAARYESSVLPLNRWFDVHAQRVGRPEDRIVGVFFADTTPQKLVEQERAHLDEEQRVLLFEQMRLLEVEQSRAAHEVLLNTISEAVREAVEPETILQAVVRTLGEGVGVDRCYFVRSNHARDIARVSPEWSRADAGLDPLGGRTFQLSTYATIRGAADSASSGAQIVNDVSAYAPDDAAPLAALKIRALMRVPIDVGTASEPMTALCIAMSNGPRTWTTDEMRLLEGVAALVRTALAAAQIQQRERRIAQQLQEALQPPPPQNLPGLALASHYRPALAEASVGGDFYDVFPLGESRTALVVADLSGKGLQAASQVATVRNMLRYALYNDPNLPNAITGLHRTLVSHSLLTGFATLFVGIYDDLERTFTYVNCGQEPGLIWRCATRSTEMLTPTGPVLGGFGSGDYEQEIVQLSDGDVIALFTDGLTEVGPTRKIQLEVTGVSEVLRDCCGENSSGVNSPQDVVDCLISGVDDFARGGNRDDIALLVGVVGQAVAC